MQPTEGYHCSYTQRNGIIETVPNETTTVVTIPQNYLSDLSRYKIWIEYETGLGYKQVFSNLVIK